MLYVDVKSHKKFSAGSSLLFSADRKLTIHKLWCDNTHGKNLLQDNSMELVPEFADIFVQRLKVEPVLGEKIEREGRERGRERGEREGRKAKLGSLPHLFTHLCSISLLSLLLPYPTFSIKMSKKQTC